LEIIPLELPKPRSFVLINELYVTSVVRAG